MVGSHTNCQNQEELKNENRKYTIRTAVREQHMARHHPNRYGGRSEAGSIIVAGLGLVGLINVIRKGK
jgi:hypothetical protein